MTESYSNRLIRFALENYIDLASGNLTVDKMAEFTLSKGRKNPMETQNCWKADIDRAISSLAPKYDVWCFMYKESFECIRFNLHKLAIMQRTIVSDCIFKECYKFGSEYDCPNDGIISRLRRYLNHEIAVSERKKQPRGLDGKWIRQDGIVLVR